MPAPDSPVTSRFESSAWAFCMFSCICCAWRIRLPSPPFIMILSLLLVGRFHRSAINRRAESLLQPLDGRIRLKGCGRAHHLVLIREHTLARRRRKFAVRHLEDEPDRATQIF